jgi:predicted phosphoribosyltransferase
MLPDSTFYTGLAVGARTARAAQSVHRRTSAVVMDAVPFASCSCVTTLSSTG